MAKVRHRIFEMYEFREEAVDTLTPRLVQPVTDTEVLEPWTLKHMAVSRLASFSHVEFKKAQSFEEETEKKLREGLTQLADSLIRESKVLFDFTGVTSISSASLRRIARTKVLCHCGFESRRHRSTPTPPALAPMHDPFRPVALCYATC